MSKLKKTKTEVKKPNFEFIKPYATAKKNYNIGDKIYFENEKVIEFLLTQKIIKKWQH
jgi:hypothetical protein